MAWKLELSEPVLKELYAWVDQIPLSKPRRKIERDFADGILVAEVVRHYFPNMIDMHNYASSGSFSQKKNNWETLNKKIFGRFELHLPDVIINDLSNAKQGTIEILLFNLRLKINKELDLRKQLQKQPQQQQNMSLRRQPLLSSNTVGPTKEDKSFLSKRTNETSRSVTNLSNKMVSSLDFEQLKQQCLQQQKDIQILQVKMRRVEHVAQLKDIGITGLSGTIENSRHTKPTTVVANKYKNK